MPGPGTELEKLLLSLRLRARATCDCRSVLLWMDTLGVDGCKRDRHLILDRLRENAAMFSTSDWVIAAMSACANGLVFALNPVDPIPRLLEEAIRRAENRP